MYLIKVLSFNWDLRFNVRACACAGWLREGEGGLGDYQPGVYVPLKALFLVGQAVSEEKIFEYYVNKHVYCPGMGAYKPLGTTFFRIINIQSY